MTIDATIQYIQSGLKTASVALLLGTLGLACLLWRFGTLRGTTLVAPWCWAVVSIVAVTGTEVVIGLSGSSPVAWHEPIRFAAAATVFCPLVAALGAKRPQDKAWQLIVLSLWIVLILPALGNLLLQSDQPLKIPLAWSLVLIVLLLVSAVNSLPTRFWLSSLLLTAAQGVLLAPYLPWSLLLSGATGVLAALTLSTAAIALAALGLPPKRRAEHAEDRLWLDFRDTYGALWALRFAERVNATANMHHWNLTLSWRGFRRTDTPEAAGEIPPDVAATLRATIRNLLRRFVSPQWIASRINGCA